MPEFPIPSARILLVSQIQGGQLPSLPPVRYAYDLPYEITQCYLPPDRGEDRSQAGCECECEY